MDAHRLASGGTGAVPPGTNRGFRSFFTLINRRCGQHLARWKLRDHANTFATGSTMGGNTASRALVTVTVSPDQQFQLTPPSLLSGETGYRPRISFGLPPLTLGGTSVPDLPPGLR